MLNRRDADHAAAIQPARTNFTQALTQHQANHAAQMHRQVRELTHTFHEQLRQQYRDRIAFEANIESRANAVVSNAKAKEEELRCEMREQAASLTRYHLNDHRQAQAQLAKRRQ